MSGISNIEAALLGLLSEGAMYPYQIEQEVYNRDMRSWTELSMSSIYKVLRKLEQDGYVKSSNLVTAENRLRKLYEISIEGKAALIAKIESLLSEPEHVRWRVNIATYNIDLLSNQVIEQALENYRKLLLERIKEYEDVLKCMQEMGCPKHRFGVVTRQIYLWKSELDWLKEYSRELSQ